MKGAVAAARRPRKGLKGGRGADDEEKPRRPPSASSAAQRKNSVSRGDAESSEGLPEGWARCSVGDVFRSFSGGTPNRSTAAYWGGRIPWLSSGDIKSVRIGSASESITKAGLDNSSAKLCRPGSVLIVVRSGILKHTLPVAVLDREAAINQDIKCFDSGSDSLNEWLAVALRCSEQALLSHNREGTTVQSVKYETLKNFEFWVPPISEQRRIVAKLEALLGHVDACRKRLERIPTLLKRFRQAVLAAACSGRLTADWRAEHSASSVCSARGEAHAENSGSDGKTSLAEGAENGEGLPDLPEMWRWVPFGSVIGELRNGISLRPNMNPPGTPILRISATRSGRIDLGDVRFMPNGNRFVSLYALRDGDLLFTRYNGSLDLLGVCGMVRGLGKEILLYPDKLMRVRFARDDVLPAYTEVFFSAPEVHERLVAKSKSSAGQNGVSGSDIKAQPFALPPFAEQQEIVRRVEKLFALADGIEARHTKARAQVEALTPAILAKAFRGELVPQDPSDEPASVLLERIQSAMK